MNVFNATATNAKSLTPSRKRKATDDQNQLKIQSIREVFLASYHSHQNWSIPDSIAFYIAKSPSSSNVYQKLTYSCKYFYVKNPIAVVENLYYSSKDNWEASVKGIRKCINFSNSTRNAFWITKEFGNSNFAIGNTYNLISSIIPQIYGVEVKTLKLNFQTFLLKQFLFLSSNVEDIDLHCCFIKDENGSIVPLEKLVQALTNVKIFKFYSPFAAIPTSNTIKELLKIPHFLKLDVFKLCGIPELSDINILFDYIKKNKHTKFSIQFIYSISEDYKKQIEAIIDEIISTESHEYIPPFIHYSDLNFGKFLHMRSIYHQL